MEKEKIDVFDRQSRIEGWNQKKLSSQTALCLGTGGLGSVLIMNFLRLGLKKLIIIDKDKIEAHNLNRQLLFTMDDIGIPKVEAAKKNSDKFHNISNTIIEAHNFCALQNWDKIVDFAKESSIIFNCIDVGDYFDLAVQSLALALKKNLISGGTFASSLTVDFFKAGGQPCYLCVTDGLKPDVVEKLHPKNIIKFKDLLFIPRDNNPVGQSNIFLCSTCANFMTSIFVNDLFGDEDYKAIQRLIFYVNTFEIVKFCPEPNEKCLYCK